MLLRSSLATPHTFYIPCLVSNFLLHVQAASKSSCRFAVLIGEAEVERGVMAIKDMRSGEQTELPQPSGRHSDWGALQSWLMQNGG